MNYDLITLVAKLRNAETPEQISEVKALGESFMRKEKNYALLTLMAVAEELGRDELLRNIDELRNYIETIAKK